jgi:predicted nuclease with TOPRIM domain
MHKAQHDEIVGSRVGQFSDLHKLLAEKDLRIQELLMELRSYKEETGSYIEELQETITHLEQNNRELESTIKELRSELSFNKILIAEKNQFI